MISIGQSSADIDDITSKVSEADILSFYLGITNVPCVIKSPLREDKRPSFGLYSSDGIRIYYIDYSTKDSGGIFDLLGKLWSCDYKEVITRIYNDLPKITTGHTTKDYTPCIVRKSIEYSSNTELKCKTREWRQYDLDYWNSYGISIEWLKYAEVYPISHKIIIKDNKRFVFSADKYAYAYVEHKDNKVTLKIYQPYNKLGYKWSNKHDSSVLSLWTKVPEKGKIICICSSLKDALCLWANAGIPSIAVQGEGYKISDTAIKELEKRFAYVCILFDNDEPGLIDGEKLAEETGFINIVLKSKEKDISDLYHSLQDSKRFKEIIIGLFKQKIKI